MLKLTKKELGWLLKIVALNYEKEKFSDYNFSEKLMIEIVNNTDIIDKSALDNYKQ